MIRAGFIRQQLLFWGLILGLWFLLVLAFAGQLMLTGNVPWQDALVLSLRDWFPWAMLAPIVAWLSSRFPIERGRWGLSVPIHIAACMLALVACDFLARPAPPHLGPPPGAGFQRFAQPGLPENFPPAQGSDLAIQTDRPPEFRPPGERRENLPPGPPMHGEGRRRFFMEGLVMRAKFNIPIYWIIVSITHALTWYRRSQERERSALQLEARLADARLEALRMQLHPHFLFNTLNAISTLVHRDPHAADEMIGNLSELLRATLDTTAQKISLRQELHFLDRYLEIQQLRFGDRLKVEKEIDAAALDIQVPTLILQPLVENAIRHGVEPQTGQGRLQITVSREGQTLRLCVRDNGPAAKTATEKKAGIGIANTRSRLQELYGQTARLTLSTASDGGFMATIDLPCHHDIAKPDSLHENSHPDRR